MPYTIKTKDGITILDIPDDIPRDDPRLQALVQRLRAAGQTMASFPPPASAGASPTASPPPPALCRSIAVAAALCCRVAS